MTEMDLAQERAESSQGGRSGISQLIRLMIALEVGYNRDLEGD